MITAAEVSSQLDSIPSMVVLIEYVLILLNSRFYEFIAKLTIFFERCKSTSLIEHMKVDFFYLIGVKSCFFINFVVC